MSIKKGIIFLFIAVSTVLFMSACRTSAIEAVVTPNFEAEAVTLNKSLRSSIKELACITANKVFEDVSVTDNKCYSPVSLYMALAMCAETAGGDSRKEILDVMGYSSIEDLRNDSQNLYKAIFFDDEMESHTKLIPTNAVFINKVINVNKGMPELLSEKYIAEVFKADFNGARVNEEIAAWLTERNKGVLEAKGNKFVSDKELFVLINTIYFKSEWLDLFDKSENVKDAFTCRNGNVIQTDYMTRTINPHEVLMGDSYTATQMTLKRGSVMFILPDEGVMPEDILNDYRTMTEIMEFVKVTSEKVIMAKVNFKIPKFKFVSQIDLKETLKNIGIDDIFEDNADFSELTDNDSIFVSSVIQNASFSMDENGCEASAFTQIGYYGAREAVDGVVDFTLDKPYIVIVINKGMPLFISVINQPN